MADGKMSVTVNTLTAAKGLGKESHYYKKAFA